MGAGCGVLLPSLDGAAYTPKRGEVHTVERSRMLLVAAAVAVAMLVAAPTLPATAQSSEDPSSSSSVFFPVRLGNGGTYSCTGGPPFVVDEDEASTGNCSLQRIGGPEDLACDAPASITFVHDGHRFEADGSLCHE